MKFSKETLAIMNNFAAVNGNLGLQPGSFLETVAPERNIRVSAKIEEEIPSEFYIYDMSTFLAVLNMMPEADLIFNGNTIEIVDGNKKLRYGSADKSILALPQGAPHMKITPYVEINIDDGTITAIKKAAAIFGLPNLRISGDGKVIKASVIDIKNPSTNVYEVELGKTDSTFNADFLISTIKLIGGDYKVTLDSKYVSRWVLESPAETEYTMYIAMTQTSKFE